MAADHGVGWECFWGKAKMHVEISEKPFNPWQKLEAHHRLLDKQGKAQACGATTVFIGTMRDVNQDEKVISMRLEHYAEMTRSHIERFIQTECAAWPFTDVLVVHRVGTVYPADTIVLVAVWAAHRDTSYRVNRLIMEELKSRAPFWKKEQLAQGSRWLSAEKGLQDL